MYRLRELCCEDLEIINMWRNDSELINCLGAPFRYINIEVDKQWFESYMNNRNTTVRCAIVSDNNEIQGLISLTNIDYINRAAVLHIMIGDKNSRNKGMGSFAVHEVLKHAFMNLNLHRVKLDVLENNMAAQHVYEKCGFVKEGISRKAVYKNGCYIDLIQYSILKEEFWIKEDVDS